MESKERGTSDTASKETQFTRRSLLGLLATFGLPTSTSAQVTGDKFTVLEVAGRSIEITPEAQDRMKELGISITGSQISGPVDFKRLEPTQEHSGQAFVGICLAPGATKITVAAHEGQGPEGEVKVLSFTISDTAKMSEIVIFSVIPGSSSHPKNFIMHRSPKLFREGQCEMV